MIKKVMALLLCLSFLLLTFPVSANNSVSVTAAFEGETTVGQEACLKITVPEGVTSFKAHIKYNAYFYNYRGDGVGFDIKTGEYTISVTPHGNPIYLYCTSYNYGTAVLTLNSITCETADGTITLDDILVQVEVHPDYTYIYTKEDLSNIRNDLSGEYLLMNDITFTEADFSEDGAFYNDGFGWIPIGAVVKEAFTGMFNGNGHTISGLKINKAYYNYCGLFGVNKGAVIDLRLTDANIDGRVGLNMSSKKSQPQILGSVDYEDEDVWTEPDDNLTEESLKNYDRTGESSANVGIACGFNMGRVQGVYCSGVVRSNVSAGGIAGRNSGIIRQCATDGEVISKTIAGGIVGVAAAYSDIYDVVVKGRATGTVVGGLVGNAAGSIKRAYTLAEVISDDAFASFGKYDALNAQEIYAFGNANPDGITEIKELSQLPRLRFSSGEWSYTPKMPYPTPLIDIIKVALVGDVNADGQVNTTDLAQMKLFLVDLADIDEPAGDFNADGTVTTADLAQLKIKLVFE